MHSPSAQTELSSLNLAETFFARPCTLLRTCKASKNERATSINIVEMMDSRLRVHAHHTTRDAYIIKGCNGGRRRQRLAGPGAGGHRHRHRHRHRRSRGGRGRRPHKGEPCTVQRPTIPLYLWGKYTQPPYEKPFAWLCTLRLDLESISRVLLPLVIGQLICKTSTK